MASIHADPAVFSYTAYSQDAVSASFQGKEDLDVEPKNIFKAQELCPCSKDDFIIFAEFSEVMGPIPLLTVPSCVEDSGEVDINSLIMKIMSVDYQSNPSGQFTFCQDVEVLQANVAPGTHAYVHYCTLHDLKARGFVRPLCIAYVSSDHEKLHTLFPLLRRQFLETTDILKYNNRQWFMDEISKVINSVKGLQNRYFYWKKKEEDGLPLTPEEQKLLRETNMDQLVHQYTEHKHMLLSVEPLLIDQETKDCVSEWKCGFVSMEAGIVQVETYMLKLRHEILNKTGRECLRSIVALSPWGLAAAIWRLLVLLRTHSHCRLERSLCMFPVHDPPSLPQLSVDSALMDLQYLRLISNVVQPLDPATDKIIQESVRSQDFLTQDSLEYLEVNLLTSGNEGSSSYHSVPESISELLSLEKPLVPTRWSDASSDSSRGSHFSASTESFLDVSETDSWDDRPCDGDQDVRPWVSCAWSCGKPLVRHLAGHKVLKFFQTFPKAAHHVVYSLLIGRTVVLAGSEEAESRVSNIMMALTPLVPVSKNHSLRILRWHRGILVSSHITSYQLIGMCVPERLSVHDMISPRDKNLVTILDVASRQLFGPAYSGQLLSSLETAPQLFPSDLSLLLFLQSVAAGLHEKLFLANNGHSRADSGLYGCDAEIIKHLLKIGIVVGGG